MVPFSRFYKTVYGDRKIISIPPVLRVHCRNFQTAHTSALRFFKDKKPEVPTDPKINPEDEFPPLTSFPMAQFLEPHDLHWKLNRTFVEPYIQMYFDPTFDVDTIITFTKTKRSWGMRSLLRRWLGSREVGLLATRRASSSCAAFQPVHPAARSLRYVTPTRQLLNTQPLHCCLLRRFSSSDDQLQPLPELTTFPICVWPNLFYSFRNFIFSRLIIKRYLDENFDLDKFVDGSKHAVEVVAEHISNGKMNELNELVTPEVIEEISQNIKQFNLKQRMELAVNKDDIFACYVHDIGVIFPDETSSLMKELPQQRFVEITLSYHILKGYKDFHDPNVHGAFKPFTVPDFEKNLYILSYRFIRDYSEGKGETYWIINALNHFKPLAKY